MRILFTGGSGKAGRHATAYLRDQGHRVTSLDWATSDTPGIAHLTTDLTDAGQVFNACRAYASLDELAPGTGVPNYDAIVHFAAIPAILRRPDNETWRINTLSTYNVLDAATKLGIPKVIFASSETTYGICFADGEKKPEYLPVDEEHPTVPQDSYAMSKVVNVANDDLSVSLTSAEVIERFYPEVPLKREMGEFETFYSNEKARRLVGFVPEHSWRDELVQ